MSLNGFLNIHKPKARTSRQVVTAIKTLLLRNGFSPKTLPKMGHAGTLDPMATGVLVVCLGHGTRFIERLHSQTKSYRATFLFGKNSNTDDITGEVVDVAIERAADLTRDELNVHLPSFVGRIEQIPPAFSAVLVEGRRAYALARRGEEVALKPKTVEIHRLEVVRFEPPTLELDIECSSGTYIRSLGRDLGERLGCGAVMSALSRTRVGSFELSVSTTPNEITFESLQQKLQPCLSIVEQLPRYACEEHEVALLSRGSGISPRDSAWVASNSCALNAIPTPPADPTKSVDSYALVDPQGILIGIGGWDHILPVLRPRINLITTHEPILRETVDNQ
ncbi:MAG: tRNA pseudouridine(55) synthase TruB [Planctomycetia bacterium]|nr:tRNA pseudouridine(55) synthase TruB [Planctomycetia bacterium]